MLENMTITGVASREISGARGPGTIYEIDVAEGRSLQTFNYDLAILAQAAIGHNVQVDFTEKSSTKTGRDGQPRTFINRYLNAIAPASLQQQMPLPAAAPPMGRPLGPVQPGIPSAPGPLPPGPGIPTASDPKGPEIRRSVGVKVAVQALQYFERPEQTVEALFLVADRVANYLEYGSESQARPTFASDPEVIDSYGQDYQEIPF